MRLTTYLLVPRLVMSGAIPQLPPHASMACIGTTIPLPFVQMKAVIVWDVMLCMV